MPMMPRHERADWRNEGRTLHDRLDRYLRPENYDGGDVYVWDEYTIQDVADTVSDYRAERTRRVRGAADSVHEESTAQYPSSAYSLSCRNEARDRWDVMRYQTLVTTLTLDGTEDFLREIDAGATEAEASRRAHSADLARGRRSR